MTAARSGRRSAVSPPRRDALDSLREHRLRAPMPGEPAGEGADVSGHARHARRTPGLREVAKIAARSKNPAPCRTTYST